jgi:large subunit ribosomal protein L6
VSATIKENRIDFPDDVSFALDNKKLTVSGENGSISRDFSHALLNFAREENSLKIWAVNPRKREASLVNTLSTHVDNMIKGVKQGFTYRMKIVFVHFPMTVRVNGRRIIIQNFIGERKDRMANIVGDVQVTIEGEDIIVKGVDIEKVAQTAANIQQATRIRRKDLRKFLDGIYVYSKE